jgi:hypothetical protein
MLRTSVTAIRRAAAFMTIATGTPSSRPPNSRAPVRAGPVGPSTGCRRRYRCPTASGAPWNTTNSAMTCAGSAISPAPKRHSTFAIKGNVPLLKTG